MQADDEEERQKNELHKLLASKQRTVLSQLYLDRNRPSFDNGVSLEAFTPFHWYAYSPYYYLNISYELTRRI